MIAAHTGTEAVAMAAEIRARLFADELAATAQADPAFAALTISCDNAVATVRSLSTVSSGTVIDVRFEILMYAGDERTAVRGPMLRRRQLHDVALWHHAACSGRGLRARAADALPGRHPGGRGRRSPSDDRRAHGQHWQ